MINFRFHKKKTKLYNIRSGIRTIEVTAFSARKGHYDYPRYPVGLKNSPVTFKQWYIFNIFTRVH